MPKQRRNKTWNKQRIKILQTAEGAFLPPERRHGRTTLEHQQWRHQPGPSHRVRNRTVLLRMSDPEGPASVCSPVLTSLHTNVWILPCTERCVTLSAPSCYFYHKAGKNAERNDEDDGGKKGTVQQTKINTFYIPDSFKKQSLLRVICSLLYGIRESEPIMS